MKIKHFACYGCVEAKKISLDHTTLIDDYGCAIDAVILKVRVTGFHKWGLVRDSWDKWGHYMWLVKRFYKKCESDRDIYKIDIDSVNFEECIYTYTIRC